MPQPILDLNNSDYWQSVYETTLTASSVVEGHHTPIPAHLIPAVFDSHTLLVGASSFKVKPTWRLGFWLSMILNVPGIGSFATTSRSVPLGLNLIRFPPLSSQFKLKANIPKWHQEMSMKFWQYTGPESDVLDLLEKVETGLDQIESKLSTDPDGDAGTF